METLTIFYHKLYFYYIREESIALFYVKYFHVKLFTNSALGTQTELRKQENILRTGVCYCLYHLPASVS